MSAGPRWASSASCAITSDGSPLGPEPLLHAVESQQLHASCNDLGVARLIQPADQLTNLACLSDAYRRELSDGFLRLNARENRLELFEKTMRAHVSPD